MLEFSRSYKIVATNLRNRFSFLLQNFSQVRERYIFLNFQNFRESRSVKIVNGKITLCAERGMAITFVCDWGNGVKDTKTVKTACLCGLSLA